LCTLLIHSMVPHSLQPPWFHHPSNVGNSWNYEVPAIFRDSRHFLLGPNTFFSNTLPNILNYVLPYVERPNSTPTQNNGKNWSLLYFHFYVLRRKWIDQIFWHKWQHTVPEFIPSYNLFTNEISFVAVVLKYFNFAIFSKLVLWFYPALL
jgi:hypothetical protein